MYHVSAQGVDERMINVRYYYYQSIIFIKIIEVRMKTPLNSIDGKYPNVQSRDPSDNLAQSTESILFTDTHARLSRATAHSWPASAILFNPTSLLFNPTSLSRTQQKEASCGASPRGVAHKCTFPKMCINLSKAVHALSFLVLLAWLYVTRLTGPTNIMIFSPSSVL